MMIVIMAAGLSEEDMDILTTMMDCGDEASYDKNGVSLKFLANATDTDENRLKTVLKKLIKEGYVEHRFFSDNTDDYTIRDKGKEALGKA